MIVWVASYPRSGNRLCRANLRGPFGQTTASAASDRALRNDIPQLLDVLGVGPEDDPLPALRDYDRPVFLKTHSQPEHIHCLPVEAEGILQRADRGGVSAESEGSPAIYLVRDGRDCLVSFAHYLREVAARPRFMSMTFEESIADLMRRPAPYGGWSGNVGAWRRRDAPTRIVRFADLVSDPIETIKGATAALDLSLPEPDTPPPSFEQLRSRSRKPQLLRRGRAGGWRTEFPPDLLDEFWQLHGAEMEALGFPRD